jgi:hypothetical protein
MATMFCNKNTKLEEERGGMLACCTIESLSKKKKEGFP